MMMMELYSLYSSLSHDDDSDDDDENLNNNNNNQLFCVIKI